MTDYPGAGDDGTTGLARPDWMGPTAYAVIALAVLVGATVQSTVGLGVGRVAAPVTTLVEPSLMPGVLLMSRC